jgi:hypothetical protein
MCALLTSVYINVGTFHARYCEDLVYVSRTHARELLVERSTDWCNAIAMQHLGIVGA